MVEKNDLYQVEPGRQFRRAAESNRGMNLSMMILD